MDFIQSWLVSAGVPYAETLTLVLGITFLLIACYVSHVISRRILLVWIHSIAQASKASWDDVLLEQKTFDRLAHLAPAIVLQLCAPIFFPNSPDIVSFLSRINDFYVIWVVVAVVFSILNAVGQLYLLSPKAAKEFPIKVIIQVFSDCRCLCWCNFLVWLFFSMNRRWSCFQG